MNDEHNKLSLDEQVDREIMMVKMGVSELCDMPEGKELAEDLQRLWIKHMDKGVPSYVLLRWTSTLSAGAFEALRHRSAEISPKETS